MDVYIDEVDSLLEDARQNLSPDAWEEFREYTMEKIMELDELGPPYPSEGGRYGNRN